MKLNKIINSGLIIFATFFYGCTKDADVKLPQVESKLVINSFISPQDTVIKVAVTLSQPLYNNSNSGAVYSVTNAIVQISDGNISKILSYNYIENNYQISAAEYPVIAGVTYYLSVSTPDGKKINSSTTIPAINSTLTFTSEAINDPEEPNAHSINCNWTDSPGVVDYYRISYYDKFYDSWSDTTYSLRYTNNYTDKDSDGKQFIEDFEVQKSDFLTGPSGEIYLIHATKEYYLFHSKLNDAVNSGNPFAESVQMYSNINGGYGIFAGFNQYKLEVFL